ncbi:polysaccharide pyruvyl transferase family protein [Antribacter sp. KLBMP9083]|uniref:Polysaccharide pyruvyl transferase family protein n=1 Tax=Antribacter soli TaxID=2910976 RepID=A0AA41QF07_9MICO|nr:polysaccharide pyruvyl transferase family protein [Antribacter soli]MCF4122238.1 polysaccharide pyruvyl transferase family protein [Antribacter soli]
MTTRTSDSVLLDELRQATSDALAAVVGTGKDVVLLDAPNQRNVGDSLIWAGEVEYFRRLGLRTRYVADRRSYDPAALRASLRPGGTVLIHGGGNFGDLWETHQSHREQIASDLPDYRIVQLPQSIWFQSPARAQRANRLLGAHPDFHLLVRDRESAARAAAQLPDVSTSYCWDMALGWRPARPVTRGTGVLVLARSDHEGTSGLSSADLTGALDRPVPSVDWQNRGLAEGAWHALRLVPRLVHRFPVLRRPALRPLTTAAITGINRINIDGGVRLLGGAGLVVVDRLHAHILAVHLGIPHVLLDNSYGKLKAVYDDYTGRFSTAHYARDLDEAIALAADLHDQSRR